ncbi:dephospho-CoA kinase-domain-containing protein [Coniella lustricola]|uniref:Dephospho-CoA kinase-domain-containing protein n=1 Tax=Coniella lustricola TaxID=2025994 RepID=A0A2T3AB60_9PEZI|nr:dephospho-CoA kinase-domain-containing protein [Coniella lustricola]
MLIIGLTGGIATGKSTVSSMLSSPPYNLPIIDADVLARQVVEPGTPGYRAIVAHFGPTTPDLLVPATTTAEMPPAGPTGQGRPLNRPALGRRVFGDSAQAKADRAWLNGVVHPAVRRAAYKALLWAFLRGNWAVVWDVPLLFEVGTDRYCGTVVVVGVRDPQVQMQRLRARDVHLSAEDAENRVKSQMDVRVKARRCQARGAGRGEVVWNDGNKEDLKREVERVFGRLRGASPWWWSSLLWVCPPLAVGVGAWNLWVNRRIAKRWEAEEASERAKL